MVRFCRRLVLEEACETVDYPRGDEVVEVSFETMIHSCSLSEGHSFRLVCEGWIGQGGQVSIGTPLQCGQWKRGRVWPRTSSPSNSQAANVAEVDPHRHGFGRDS